MISICLISRHNSCVSCAGTSHLDSDVGVGFFFIAYKHAKSFSLTTIHKTETKTLQTEKHRFNKFFCICFISQPKPYERNCFVTCLLFSGKTVFVTCCMSALLLNFLKLRGKRYENCPIVPSVRPVFFVGPHGATQIPIIGYCPSRSLSLPLSPSTTIMT